MSIETSYFAKSSDHPKAVAISATVPEGFKGLRFKDLAPPYDLLGKFKRDDDESFFEEQYRDRVLKDLDPQKIYDLLGHDAVLLCWEKSGKFCHRHIVADWLSKSLNIEISEFDSLF